MKYIKSQPIVSVITINYNNSCGLLHTLDSVISVLNPTTEFIVVDGGSDDGSEAVIEHHAAAIDVWIGEKDGGIYDAMNKGVAYARGEFCIFMNSGDAFYDHDALERLKPGENDDVVYGDAVNDATGGLWSFNDALWKGMICSHQSALIRTALLREHPYRRDLRIAADYEFFVWAETSGRNFRRVAGRVARLDVTGTSFDAFEERTVERARICKQYYRSEDVQRFYVELLRDRGYAPPEDILLGCAAGAVA